jgi:hypothetical protein
VLTQLESTLATIASARGSLEHLLGVVTSKEQERTQLEKVIGEQYKQSEAYKAFTDEQKALMSGAVKAAQRRSVIVAFVAVVGSLMVNIAATLIWTLLGNPGRQEILQRFDYYFRRWFPQ